MSRQPQRVHKPFYRLNRRANFFIGRSVYEKTTFCTARLLRAYGANVRINLFIAPWTVVRSEELVNKRGQSCPPLCAPIDVLVASKLADSGHTHYVGDSCPGGHAEPGPVAQPNSDNNITGPTS